MAAIDKLYVKHYGDLHDLRNWALIYYPELFIWWYSDALTMSSANFTKYVNNAANLMMKRFHNSWEEISPDDTLNGAIATLMKAPYYMSTEEAGTFATEVYNNKIKPITSLRNEVTFPVMNTSLTIDRKLKWICPVPCVREYLQKQCGVKEHWYYKLFWKGKQYFTWLPY